MNAAMWVAVMCAWLALGAAVARGSANRDAMALRSFKSAVGSDPAGVLSSWDSNGHHCQWFGVKCDGGLGRVIGLNLTGNGGLRRKDEGLLAGALTDSVGNLTELRALSLPYNAFSGEIPATVGHLRKLEILELQGNFFSGHLPGQLSHLPSLTLLNLSGNAFSGSIPPRLIGSGRLASIDLSDNGLSGKIRIAGGCQFLSHLKLSGNSLVGNIPAEIGSCTKLRVLLLDGNVLEGEIPDTIGRISELMALDVSRNCLVGRIPKELAQCRKLAVIVLTNPEGSDSGGDRIADSSKGEFNAFKGGIPPEVLLLPNLEMFWAPRANLGGRLTVNWSSSCPLRVLNLGQNYIDGVVPESLGSCRNLTFLDLSSNGLAGNLPSQLNVPCMVYFNVSLNFLSGSLPSFNRGSCADSRMLPSQDTKLLYEEDIRNAYYNVSDWRNQVSSSSGSMLPDSFAINHDFSWNNFTGSVPRFLISSELLGTNTKSYRLMLNNNDFNGSLPRELVLNCSGLSRFSVNLNANQLSGSFDKGSFLGCSKLTELKAAFNYIDGSIDSVTANFVMLEGLDLRGNRLSGYLPDQLGTLIYLNRLLLGGNNFTGPIPTQLGQLTSLKILDLSENGLLASIPESLAKATKLESIMLNHNRLSGNIPSSLATLASLSVLDVSFNNLSGHIPHFQQINCSYFRGNELLHSCPDISESPTWLPVPLEIPSKRGPNKWKLYVIATVIPVFFALLAVSLIFALIYHKRKSSKVVSIKRKVVVTFADAPEVDYEDVTRATGNFSVRNLIGTGGFGSTYRAELSTGDVVAVKRLSIGRFQGCKQFDAEIRTLGQIRHRNLVTLIGYYAGDAEMFLIYNYLPGGNLETFIHDRSSSHVQWPVILKISIDIAQALTFLHYSCAPRIVHRDIKPSNILLDEEFNAYLSDFGLAKILEVSETHATTDVEGTFGYVAPEYANTRRVSDKADVYSFGIVMLELLSGKKSLDPSFSEYGNGFNIVGWAKLLLREKRESDFFAQELWELGPKEKLLVMLKLAARCTVDSLAVRPTMKLVLEKLRQVQPSSS
uniref:non-specific serine/threonine protein kinase n=1 Tax=Kalanchoe fedtschenkoi TaxID=63787 RepID=A0A7N0U8Y4_KALFE